jgi:phenylacetate-CoA ligase
VVTPLYRDAMPLLRYNLADEVEVSADACSCGWLLPTVTVLGRSGTEHTVGSATVTQQRLEELVFSLPAEYEVMFWRAMAHSDVLRLEFEAPEPVRERAAKELGAALDRELGVPHRITGLPQGTLVPTEALTARRDILKARYLFAEGEDWDKAVMYF